MEDNGKQIKKGYVSTTRENFDGFFEKVNNSKIIVEASSTINRIANMFDIYDITAAHLAKVKLISQFVKKSDKIDVHILMDLYNKNSPL